MLETINANRRNDAYLNNYSAISIENYRGGKIAHMTFSACNFQEIWLTHAYFAHVTFEHSRNFNHKRYVADELNTFEDVEFN